MIFRIDTLIYILSIITLSALLAMCIIHKIRTKKPSKLTNVIVVITLMTNCIAFVSLIAVSVIASIGFSHGMYDMHTTVTETIEYINKTPVESELPDNLSNKIVIYYKFDCKDCHAVYDDLTDAVKNNNNIIWTSTRSNKGKKLRKTYPVEYVPTGVAFNAKNEHITFPLYKSKNGDIVLNKTNLDLLLDYIK